PCPSLIVRLTSRPPRPTLSPYTTLFRSERLGGTSHVHVDAGAHRITAVVTGESLPDVGEEITLGFLPDRVHLFAHVGERFTSDEDRKSTRLNSSHQIISYAACCLQTKNA